MKKTIEELMKEVNTSKEAYEKSPMVNMLKTFCQEHPFVPSLSNS